jgi:hypothetical protein
MLSRAKTLAQLWLRRPFAKEISTGGPPMWPNILMQKINGDLSESKVQTMFKENDEKGKKRKETVCIALAVEDGDELEYNKIRMNKVVR